MWQWLYKISSPKFFYELGSRALPWLWGSTLFLIVVGVIWGLAFAPPDYQMGDNYRIIYLHVPAAGLMKGCFYMMAICSAAVLIWIKSGQLSPSRQAPDFKFRVCAPYFKFFRNLKPKDAVRRPLAFVASFDGPAFGPPCSILQKRNRAQICWVL